MAIRDEPVVETSTILFSELVDAADPKGAREEALGQYVYFFGGGQVKKRDGLGPYGGPDST